MSLETDSIHSAISAPLPPVPQDSQLHQGAYADEPPSAAHDASVFLQQQQGKAMASHEMLSTCFNNLFSHLQMHRVNLETLLLTWLTLNDESTGDDTTQVTPFDPSKVPFITLQPAAVSSLLAALALLAATASTAPLQGDFTQGAMLVAADGKSSAQGKDNLT